MMQPTPFDPIHHPEHLFGRKDLLDQTLALLTNPHGAKGSIIYGGSRMGKTSLLRCLEACAAQRSGELVAAYCAVRSVGARPSALAEHPAWERLFLENLQGRIAKALGEVTVAPAQSFFALGNWLTQTLTARWANLPKQFTLAILLDDADLLTHEEGSRRKLDRVCDFLRALVDDQPQIGRKLAFVIAAGPVFAEAYASSGSPLANICSATRNLTPLDPDSFGGLLDGLFGGERSLLPDELVRDIDGSTFLAHFAASRLMPRISELPGTREDKKLAVSSEWPALGEEATDFYRGVLDSFNKKHRAALEKILSTKTPTPIGSVARESVQFLLYSGLIRVGRSDPKTVETAAALLCRFFSGIKTGGSAQTAPATASEKSVAWLHVSDFHFKEKDVGLRDEVLDKLIADVQEQIKRNPTFKPDFIAVTGDVAFSGQAKQLADATRFLGRLAAAAGLAEVAEPPDLRRVFVVPGNHDVDRALHRAPILSGLRGVQNPHEYHENIEALLDGAEQQDLILRRLGNYFAFTQQFPESRRLSSKKFWFSEELTTGSGLRVGIVGLTSCWASGQDEEDTKRYLVIGEKQAREALRALGPSDLRLALMHHPFTALQEIDEKRMMAALADGQCQVVLRGHKHETDVGSVTNPDRAFAMLAAGASYEWRWSRNNYLLARAVVPSNGPIVIHLRSRAFEDDAWRADVRSYVQGKENGAFSFDLPRR